jgi:TatA/E family protein of Tat protein translocase
MGPIGMQEMICIFVLALLLFGPKKLPELGRMLGRGLAEFRRAKNELKTTFESHMREIERETQLEKSSSERMTTSYSPSRPYSYPYDELGPAYENSDLNHSTESSSVVSHTEASSTESVAAHLEPERPEVPDTVPRLNGTQRIEKVSVTPEEDHR